VFQILFQPPYELHDRFGAQKQIGHDGARQRETFAIAVLARSLQVSFRFAEVSTEVDRGAADKLQRFFNTQSLGDVLFNMKNPWTVCHHANGVIIGDASSKIKRTVES
jgi:hypothetical protein